MTEKQNILFVSSIASMVLQFNLDLIERLSERFHVTVLCNTELGNTSGRSEHASLEAALSRFGANVVNIPFPRSLFEFRAVARSFSLLRGVIAGRRYKFAICQAPISSVLFRLVFWIYNGGHVAYFVHGFHFYRGSGLLSWLFFFPLEILLSRITSLTLVTNLEDFQRWRRFSFSEVIHVKGGVGVPDHFSSSRVSSLKASLSNGCEGCLFIYPAEFIARKRHRFLLDAFKIFCSEGGRGRLILPGTGPLLKSTIRYAGSLGILESVVFPGFVDDLYDYINACDISVSTSQQEGLPVNLMMAVRCGNPVIATACRGAVDLSSYAKNYVIVRQLASPREFALALHQISETFDRLSADKIDEQFLQLFTRSRASVNVISALESIDGMG